MLSTSPLPFPPKSIEKLIRPAITLLTVLTMDTYHDDAFCNLSRRSETYRTPVDSIVLLRGLKDRPLSQRLFRRILPCGHGRRPVITSFLLSFFEAQ